MIKLNIAKLLVSSASIVAFSGCSLASMPGGYSPIEQQTVKELSTSNYTPRSADERAAILTQDLFAQAAFWSREYDLNPADLEAAINLSSTLRRLGNPHKSVEVAQTTRALYPRDVDLMAELAASHIADNNPKVALPIIDTALAQRPNMARLWSLKGAALDQFEQFSQARQHYSKGLSLSPNDPKIIANVGLSYALEGDPKTAEIWLRRAANMPGASASTRQNLSLVLGLQNKFDEAEKWARRDLDPQTVANNMSYIRTLRGTSRNIPTPTIKGTTQVNLPAYSGPKPMSTNNIKSPYGQTAATSYPQRQPVPKPQIQQAQQAQPAYRNPYTQPAKISSPPPRITNYGQVNNSMASGTNVASARDAALAAARQSTSNPYASPKTRQLSTNLKPQRVAAKDVLGRIAQNNTPKTEIAQRQQQQLAGRAQAEQQNQQQVQPYPYYQNNPPVAPAVPYGVTVSYPNTAFPQTAQAVPGYGNTQARPQEQTVGQPARQRRR